MYWIMNILESCCESEFIFLPVLYSCDAIEAGHMAILALLVKEKQAMIIDPNGAPTYFDRTLNMSVSTKIENTFKNYFEFIGFTFLRTSEWTNKKYCINGNFNDFGIQSGNCVITSIMICNLISVTGLSPAKLMETFELLGKEEKVYLIKEYTIACYQILYENGKTKNRDKFYDMYGQFSKIFPDCSIDEFRNLSVNVENIQEFLTMNC